MELCDDLEGWDEGRRGKRGRGRMSIYICIYSYIKYD